MAIGLGYRHQHRGKFCVPKILKEQKKRTERKKLSYFCLCLSLYTVVFYYRRMCTLFVVKCFKKNRMMEMIRAILDTCTYEYIICWAFFSFYLKRIEFDTTY